MDSFLATLSPLLLPIVLGLGPVLGFALGVYVGLRGRLR